MNIKQLFASASLLLVAGAALADPVAGRTRADVIAEVLQARADGTLDQYEYDQGRTEVRQASKLTREQVRAEVLQARADGTLEQNEGSDTMFYQLQRQQRPNVDVRQAKAAAPVSAR